MKLLIDNSVGTSRNVVKELDEVLSLEIDPIPIPRTVIDGIRTVLAINANLIERLFNENLDMMTQVDEIIKRHKVTGSSPRAEGF